MAILCEGKYKMKKDCNQIADGRNYGIDALRLVAMFMVVILHVLGHGGILVKAKEMGGWHYTIVWLLEIFAYCAVDCYALISGYVGYTDQPKPYRYSKYGTMWLQVFVYSFGITLLAFLLGGKTITTETLFNDAFPVSSKAYWYFNAYTPLFFIIPWLNHFIRERSRREMNLIVIFIIATFSFYGCFSRSKDTFMTKSGYSFIWLLLLYFVGAWMKKYAIPEKIKTNKVIIRSLICFAVTASLRPYEQSILVSYISPTILFIAFSFLVVFSKAKLWRPVKAIVRFLSPAAFGVYLIHCQRAIWGHFIAGKFVWILEKPLWLVPILVLGVALGITVACLLVDRIRIAVFKLLKIDVLADKVFDFLVHRFVNFARKSGRKLVYGKEKKASEKKSKEPTA